MSKFVSKNASKTIDNHENEAEAIEAEEELKKFVNIRLTDFAHVFDANGERDDNFLNGLSNLLDLFRNYMKNLQQDVWAVARDTGLVESWHFC